MGGVWKDNPTKVADAFLHYYKQLLGSNHESRTLVLKKVVQLGPVCQAHHKEILNANYTADEVRAALFSIPGAKAPGPDGFGITYKILSFTDCLILLTTCCTVGTEAFQKLLFLLCQMKYTAAAKCHNTSATVRTIKEQMRVFLIILTTEKTGCRVGNSNSCQFCSGDEVVAVVLCNMDLVRQYGRKGVKPICLMKIDLQKAYDTVNWQFLQEMLEHLDFLQHFVNLVMQCVSTPMFSLMFNGSMHGFFKSKRGLR
ncbi:uncharacterized protein [Spinacia oleracea]|uniref:Reverse transcriptase domain-containing protein n=1 Tax=Spinacia oleracea TaxID=3562 RepID=A0ABM3RJJ2_SPIOL|nr:uncharacterized protein LOC130470178 [Spinacia oleracea]